MRTKEKKVGNENLDYYFDRDRKASFMEEVEKRLETASKAIVVFVTDMENGYETATVVYNVKRSYEGMGMLDIAREDIKDWGENVESEEENEPNM
jgi:hypothetical protein